MKELKQYTLVYFDFESFGDFDTSGYPFKPKHTYVYFGEIPNMLGHCIVMDYSTGKFYSGYHTDNFIEIPEEDI